MQAKVLDFGLAKMARPVSLGDNPSTELRTAAGTIAGTVQYMSPEQALGETVDNRSDLFSLGVVLYEMATGRIPFAGSSVSEVIAHILHSQPEAIARLNYDVPVELERIIRKCLEKEPDDRYQSAGELLVDLRHVRRETEPRLAETGPVLAPMQPASSLESLSRVAPARKRLRILIPTAFIFVIAAIAGTLYFRSRRTVPRLTEKDTIILSDFNNKTGDSVFDDTLKQGLSVQL